MDQSRFCRIGSPKGLEFYAINDLAAFKPKVMVVLRPHVFRDVLRHPRNSESEALRFSEEGCLTKCGFHLRGDPEGIDFKEIPKAHFGERNRKACSVEIEFALDKSRSAPKDSTFDQLPERLRAFDVGTGNHLACCAGLEGGPYIARHFSNEYCSPWAAATVSNLNLQQLQAIRSQYADEHLPGGATKPLQQESDCFGGGHGGNLSNAAPKGIGSAPCRQAQPINSAWASTGYASLAPTPDWLCRTCDWMRSVWGLASAASS